VLPPGEWYEFGTSRSHVAQKDPIKLDPRPATTPLYARAGAIVPMQAVVQHTGEKPAGPLQLQVYLPKAGSQCNGSLYQDDGESQAYEGGALLRVSYGCEVSRRGAMLTSHVVHDGFAPWWGDVEVTVYGVSRKPTSVRVDGKAIPDWTFDAAKQTAVMTVRDARRDWRLQVAY
jgi:alpha-glucosidase